jgi:hypothetical protein
MCNRRVTTTLDCASNKIRFLAPKIFALMSDGAKEGGNVTKILAKYRPSARSIVQSKATDDPLLQVDIGSAVRTWLSARIVAVSRVQLQSGLQAQDGFVTKQTHRWTRWDWLVAALILGGLLGLSSYGHARMAQGCAGDGDCHWITE